MAVPEHGQPGMVTSMTATPKYLVAAAELLDGGEFVGLFWKFTNRFRTSGLNSRTFLTVWRYLLFSSILSMFMKALL